MKPHKFLCILVLAAGGWTTSCSKSSEEQTVVVYTSVDDMFARPVAEEFQKATGIEVRLVPDTEETKSAGLLNRLIAEKERPQCDVFWSGDPARHFTSFSTRARVIIYSTKLCPAGQEPMSIHDLTDPKWKGKTCLANPLFGTTSMQAAAWFETMGEEKAKAFFAALTANDVAMLSSNGEVKRRVAAGDFAFGLTDTDDAIGAVSEGKPVGFVLPDQDGAGTLMVPNAAVLIAGAPHGENGKRFIDYLISAESEAVLAAGDAAQIPLRPGVPGPAELPPLGKIKAMTVDYAKLSERLDVLQNGFLKEWVAQRN